MLLGNGELSDATQGARTDNSSPLPSTQLSPRSWSRARRRTIGNTNIRVDDGVSASDKPGSTFAASTHTLPMPHNSTLLNVSNIQAAATPGPSTSVTSRSQNMPLSPTIEKSDLDIPLESGSSLQNASSSSNVSTSTSAQPASQPRRLARSYATVGLGSRITNNEQSSKATTVHSREPLQPQLPTEATTAPKELGQQLTQRTEQELIIAENKQLAARIVARSRALQYAINALRLDLHYGLVKPSSLDRHAVKHRVRRYTHVHNPPPPVPAVISRRVVAMPPITAISAAHPAPLIKTLNPLQVEEAMGFLELGALYVPADEPEPEPESVLEQEQEKEHAPEPALPSSWSGLISSLARTLTGKRKRSSDGDEDDSSVCIPSAKRRVLDDEMSPSKPSVVEGTSYNVPASPASSGATSRTPSPSPSPRKDTRPIAGMQRMLQREPTLVDDATTPVRDSIVAPAPSFYRLATLDDVVVAEAVKNLDAFLVAYIISEAVRSRHTRAD